MASKMELEREKDLRDLEKLKALYGFLIENYLDLESCPCCDAISIYWEGKLRASDIGDISQLKDFIEAEEKRLNENRN
jgi:hypothetical protein